MPLEQLIIQICDVKQRITQSGGKRPYGTAFLYAGYDLENGFQIYSTDPSGNYAGWKATALGKNSLQANSFLKQEYKDNMTLLQVSADAMLGTGRFNQGAGEDPGHLVAAALED